MQVGLGQIRYLNCIGACLELQPDLVENPEYSYTREDPGDFNSIGTGNPIHMTHTHGMISSEIDPDWM